MSNEESVAGINVRELLEEKQQLEEALREVDKLLDPVALPDEAQRVIRAALSLSEVPPEQHVPRRQAPKGTPVPWQQPQRGPHFDPEVDV